MAKEDVVHLRWKAALRKKARLPFAPTHLNLEDIMLSGVNQRNMMRFHSCVKPAKVQLTETEQNGGGQGHGRGAGKGRCRWRAASAVRCPVLSLAVAVSNTIRCLKAARNVDQKCPHHRQEMVLTHPSVPKRLGFDPWSETTPWRRAQQHSPVFSPGAFLGQRSLGWLWATVHRVPKGRLRVHAPS